MTTPSARPERLHILGICGTLMGSLALLARDLDFTVTGTDANVYPPMSDQLRKAGITLTEGYSADSIPADTELVMLGNAGLPRGNPAVEAVLERRLPYLSGAEWLGRYVLPGRWVIAVSGTHGKTTTTAMVSWILDQCGLDAGYLIGGVPIGLPGSARVGSTPFFVIEADEYDTSYFDRRSKFMHYQPDTLIFGNLEFDHADIFANLAAIEYQFHHLLRTVPANGLIVAPSDDSNVNRVLEAGCWTPVETFAGPGATWRIDSDDVVTVAGAAVGKLELQLLGEHNRRNALAAMAAARHAGVPAANALAALATFGGVKRRMERIFESPAVIVYDDFAHHPTAISKTLAGLRKAVGDESILAIIEPASHTMKRGTHSEALIDATHSADATFWFRPEGLRWEPALLADARTSVFAHQDALLAAALAQISAGVRHVIIMSNGGFGGFHQRLVETLSAIEL
jgi:UDP-N-acetylmuramate: L-alanyl-gamma-D-glutamyl-meso-diaminopimelate ligase